MEVSLHLRQKEAMATGKRRSRSYELGDGREFHSMLADSLSESVGFPIELEGTPPSQDITGAVTLAGTPPSQDITGAVTLAGTPSSQDITGAVTLAGTPSSQDITGAVTLAPPRDNIELTVVPEIEGSQQPSSSASESWMPRENIAMVTNSGEQPPDLGVEEPVPDPHSRDRASELHSVESGSNHIQFV